MIENALGIKRIGINNLFYCLIILLAFSSINANAQRISNIHRVFSLSDELHETSGLILYQNKIFTINDSGNEPIIYGYDLERNKIISRYHLTNGTNKDWEDIALQDSSIIVADIGNNYNTRDTLCLYRFSLPAQSTEDVSVNASQHRIVFADKQSGCTYPKLSANDMEAITVLDSSILLFSKNWIDQRSLVYSISGNNNIETAKICDTLPFRGLVTAACILPNGTYAFLGYKNYVPFIALCKRIDFKFQLINIRRFYSRFACQTEGICVVSETELLISAEKTAFRKAALYKINLK